MPRQQETTKNQQFYHDAENNKPTYVKTTRDPLYIEQPHQDLQLFSFPSSTKGGAGCTTFGPLPKNGIVSAQKSKAPSFAHVPKAVDSMPLTPTYVRESKRVHKSSAAASTKSGLNYAGKAASGSATRVKQPV